MLLLFALLAGCDKTTCTDADAVFKLDGRSSDWKKCSDGVKRGVDCTQEGKDFTCKCIVDGKTEKTFKTPKLPDMDNPGLLTVSRANCGWKLADP
jgi:hypothetical protein